MSSLKQKTWRVIFSLGLTFSLFMIVLFSVMATGRPDDMGRFMQAYVFCLFLFPVVWGLTIWTYKFEPVRMLTYVGSVCSVAILVFYAFAFLQLDG